MVFINQELPFDGRKTHRTVACFVGREAGALVVETANEAIIDHGVSSRWDDFGKRRSFVCLR